jgi:anti-sigma factor RsiW
MKCEQASALLDAYVDAQLPAAEYKSLHEHIASCDECGPEVAAIERLREEILRSAPFYKAPPFVRAQIRSALRREQADVPVAVRGWGWLAYSASLLLAVMIGSGGTSIISGERQQSQIADEIIDSHLRSLLADHLTDVQSSDKHTVKPWFAGRTDLSPPGVDLAAQGFPLIGGRLDLSEGKPVPALVYRAGKHIINVFVLPVRPNDLTESVKRRGYTLRHWTTGDLGYWAVSDAAPDEFDKFERDFRRAAGS